MEKNCEKKQEVEVYTKTIPCSRAITVKVVTIAIRIKVSRIAGASCRAIRIATTMKQEQVAGFRNMVATIGFNITVLKILNYSRKTIFQIKVAEIWIKCLIRAQN